jgi:hypothetical protein
MQWKDSDFDGFGDNAIGAKRDDCPKIAGTSTVDLQGCPDNNKDGFSDEYGEFAAAVTIMGSSPTGSWLSFASLGGAIFVALMITKSGSMARSLFGGRVRDGGKILADLEGPETTATVPVIDMNTGQIQDLSPAMAEEISHYSGAQQLDPSADYGATATQTPYDVGGDYGG